MGRWRALSSVVFWGCGWRLEWRGVAALHRGNGGRVNETQWAVIELKSSFGDGTTCMTYRNSGPCPCRKQEFGKMCL